MDNLDITTISNIDDKSLKKYQSLVHPKLLDMWVEYGHSKLLGGLVWLVHPDNLSGLLSAWLPELNDAVAFMRTAFGCIYLYHNQSIYFLDVLYNDLVPLYGDFNTLINYYFQENEYLGDILDRSLYLNAVEKYGELKPNECFGFHPALQLGGNKNLASIKKVALREYLQILLHS